jgi:hypothetical protein
MRMTGLILAVASILAIGLGAAEATKRSPAVTDPQDFCPTAVGSKWVYLRGSDTLVQTVTKVTRRIDHTEITISEEFDGKITPSDMLIVDKAGVRRLTSTREAKPAQYPLLQFPLKDKSEWPVDCAGEVGTSKVYGPEKIKVPAGTYEAFRIETEYTLHGQTRHRSKSWYAPGVGLVRQTLDGEKYLDLVLFTPGKTD